MAGRRATRERTSKKRSTSKPERTWPRGETLSWGMQAAFHALEQEGLGLHRGGLLTPGLHMITETGALYKVNLATHFISVSKCMKKQSKMRPS